MQRREREAEEAEHARVMLEAHDRMRLEREAEDACLGFTLPTNTLKFRPGF